MTPARLQTPGTRSAKTLPAAFRTHVLNTRVRDQTSALSPVRVLGSVSFMYLRHNDVYILIVTKRNANAMLAFSFMSQVCVVRFGWFACAEEFQTSLTG